MKFIDDLYRMYKDHLTGDEEDLHIIVKGILEDHSRDDFMKLVDQMDDEHLTEMVTYYVMELFRRKIADEGIGHITMDSDHTGGIVH